MVRRTRSICSCVTVLLATAAASLVIAQPANPSNTSNNALGTPSNAAGEPDPMEVFFREKNVYDGPDVRQQIATGRGHLKASRFDQAIRSLLAATALSENHIVALHLLGAAQFGAQRYFDAARTLKTALGLFPEWMRLKFDVKDQFNSTSTVFRDRIDSLRTQAVTADDTQSAELWFLLGYMQYYSEELRAAAEAFALTLKKNPLDSFAQRFIDVLAKRGVRLDSAESARPFELGAGRQYLLPGLKWMADKEYAKAADAFLVAAMQRADDADALAWMALALCADNRPDLAAYMVRRAVAIDADAVARLPKLQDVVPVDRVNRIRGVIPRTWRTEQQTAAKVLLGFLAVVEGDMSASREVLEAVAAEPSDADKPKDTAEAKAWRAAAQGLLAVLPARKTPPRLDLSKLEPAASTASSPPSNNAAGNVAANNPENHPGSNATTAANTNTNVSANTNTNSAGTNNAGNTPTSASGPSNQNPTANTNTNTPQPTVASFLKEGDALFQRASYALALEQYRAGEKAGLAQDPKYFAEPARVDIYLKISRATFALGDYTATRQALSQYLTGSPVLVRRQIQIFEGGYPEGVYPPLFRRLERYVTETPRDTDARFVLAYLLFSAQRYHESFDTFNLLHSGAATVDTVVLYYLNLLRERPYFADREDPAIKAKRYLESGKRVLAEGLYETAALDLQRAMDLSPSDESMTALLAAWLGQACDGKLSSDDRSVLFRRMADRLKAHLVQATADRWANMKLNVRGVLNEKEYEAVKAMFAGQKTAKPADFRAAYVRAFVHYFGGELREARAAFADYQKTVNESPSDEYYYFKAAADRG